MKVMTECFRAEISLLKADFQCPYIQIITHRLNMFLRALGMAQT